MAERERDDDLLLPEERGRELVAQRVGVERGERAVELVGAQRAERRTRSPSNPAGGSDDVP